MLQVIGLVNRAGLGVDRIHEELLLPGKDLPRYDADESPAHALARVESIGRVSGARGRSCLSRIA